MSRNCGWLRWSVVLILGMLIASLGPGATGSSAAPKTVQHCITPTNVDLNERYEVSEAIVAPFCSEIGSGRHWTVSNAWFMNTEYGPTPEGFVQAGDTPLADYLAKFIGVKYVVDPGTPKEKTYVFGTSDDLATLEDGGFAIANPITLGVLKPLSVGAHVVESFLLFSAMHCDGLGDVVADNCLLEGETQFPTVEFTVTPGHR